MEPQIVGYSHIAATDRGDAGWDGICIKIMLTLHTSCTWNGTTDRGDTHTSCRWNGATERGGIHILWPQIAGQIATDSSDIAEPHIVG